MTTCPKFDCCQVKAQKRQDLTCHDFGCAGPGVVEPPFAVPASSTCDARVACTGPWCGMTAPGVPVVPHVGESRFEGWYSERDFDGRYRGPAHNKQDMRDAYAAGLAEGAAGVRVDADAKDAARYRWLRDQWDRVGVLDGIMFSKSSDGTAWVGAVVLDRRIDAARGVPGTLKENDDGR